MKTTTAKVDRFFDRWAGVLLGERIAEVSKYFLLAMEFHLWSKAFEYNPLIVPDP